MTAHTPGPWELVCNGGPIEEFQVGNLSRAVCSAWVLATGDADETSANARLIAAAPDLLAVIQELSESAEYWSEYEVPLGIVDRIRAAITKATGATE